MTHIYQDRLTAAVRDLEGWMDQNPDTDPEEHCMDLASRAVPEDDELVDMLREMPELLKHRASVGVPWGGTLEELASFVIAERMFNELSDLAAFRREAMGLVPRLRVIQGMAAS